MKPFFLIQNLAFCSLIFWGCATSKNWTIEAYEDDDWTISVFREKVLAVLEHPKTDFCTDRNCIPKAVKQAYSKFYDRKFSIANPGEPFNCACFQNELPGMRLLFFAKNGAECVFVSKRGGRSCNVSVAYFKMENGKLRQMHVVGGLNLATENVETVKNELLKSENRRTGFVGDWRFAAI